MAILLSFFLSVLAFAKIPDGKDFSVNTHGAYGEPIDIIADMGATWVRAEAPWYTIETSPGDYNFDHPDLMLRNHKNSGVKVLFILAYAPSFHSSNGQSNGIPNLNAWKNYVDVMTKRYKDEVDVWEVWNEPNLTEFFVGNAKQYVDIILKPASAIIRKNDPDAMIAAPGLATLYSAKVHDWFKKLKSYGAGSYFDILSHHAYASDTRVMKRLLTENRIGKPSIAKMVSDGGFQNKPFWLTEFGCEEIEHKSEAGQARCILDQTKMILGLSWVKNIFVYALADDPRYTDQHRWGILTHDFKPKQAVSQMKSYIRY